MLASDDTSSAPGAVAGFDLTVAGQGRSNGRLCRLVEQEFTLACPARISPDRFGLHGPGEAIGVRLGLKSQMGMSKAFSEVTDQSSPRPMASPRRPSSSSR